MCKNVCMAVLFILFCTAAISQTNFVTLYEGCNFSGKKNFLPPGTYRTYQMKVNNDKLSSIEIPAGMKVTIYENDKFEGRSNTYSSNASCLESNWNDMTSSIVVESSSYNPTFNSNDYITFFNDCYSKGYSQSLRPGNYSGAQLGNLKYNISSFQISGNLRVRIYLNNENVSGYSYTLDASQSCLPDNYNDKIGSLVIEYKPAQPTYSPVGNNAAYATVYTDCNYGGNSLRLAPGYYSGEKLGLLKYDISAIEIPSNLKARVYLNNETLSGSYYTISENSSCLSSTLNNRIGSLIIEENNGIGNNNNNNTYPPAENEKVVLYTDGNYRGQSSTLLPGTYSTMSQAGFPDDALSSLTVPVGYRVVIYESENFKGKSYTITASKPAFTFSNWNDKTSSIAVYRN